MFKFKDLYVHLAPEVPAKDAPEMHAPGGGVGTHWGFLAAWGGGLPLDTITGSTLRCDPTFINHALQVMGGGADGAPLALKDYLKSAVQNAEQEPQNMHDLGELKQLEDKLKGALDEVLARKDEVIKSKAAAAAK